MGEHMADFDGRFKEMRALWGGAKMDSLAQVRYDMRTQIQEGTWSRAKRTQIVLLASAAVGGIGLLMVAFGK